MVGECLGELGAVDPYAISFSFRGQSELHPAHADRMTNDQQIASAKVPNRFFQYHMHSLTRTYTDNYPRDVE